MKNILFNHLVPILSVAIVFTFLLGISIDSESKNFQQKNDFVESVTKLNNVDLGNPLHRVFLRETMNLFHPHESMKNDSLIQAIDAYRSEQFTNRIYKSGGREKKLTLPFLARLAGMYLSFIFVYLIVMVVSYYATQTLALYTFIKRKQRVSSTGSLLLQYSKSAIQDLQKMNIPWKDIGMCLQLSFVGILTCFLYVLLFTPAYIIAYSMRSTFESGRYFFMIVLGVISNGLLITYAHKFYTFLLNESRKGYIETAIAKGLNNSYNWNTPEGISLRSVVRWRKTFLSHVLQHIYTNARYQYIPTLKQYASFLITGLVIIEMALNLQGHLCYELLQDILYRQYDIALVIIFGIFLIVKMTEIFVDYLIFTESRKYENPF